MRLYFGRLVAERGIVFEVKARRRRNSLVISTEAQRRDRTRGPFRHHTFGCYSPLVATDHSEAADGAAGAQQPLLLAAPEAEADRALGLRPHRRQDPRHLHGAGAAGAVVGGTGTQAP